DNRVIGFEPWEEFPFNRGMLCPKGVKRYMQSGHPDRLLAPLIRESSGFREANWDEALNRVASRIREIQERHGPDAVAVYGGASLTTEKDRKSTRLNSSHEWISYAVFCLKKKKKEQMIE